MSNKRHRLLLVGLAAGFALALVLFLVLQRDRPFNLAAIQDESQPVPIVGRDHIAPGVPPSRYNSNPPTSGDHYPAPLRAAFYEQQVPDAYLVHNLEHGHIWLSWRDEADREAIELFRQLHEQFPEWVVVSHRPENDKRLASAAWGRLLKLDAPDRDALIAFIMRYRDKAPESVPG
ncbi:MAG: DUF3105 domain-containing protein [Anaerolineaceae bacterium]|nr:DUF3105 domain-containing protein [Anaerolineaceae bacterium]MDE0328674.1 DUF3105 domain-containing protein [Anaerolineaceae bacterium]